MEKNCTAVLLVLCSILVLLDASCYIDWNLVMAEDGDVYCRYKTKMYRLGTSYETENCARCDCKTGATQCCGYGIHAGVIALPEGCELNKIDCYTGQLIQSSKPGSAVCKEDGFKLNFKTPVV